MKTLISCALALRLVLLAPASAAALYSNGPSAAHPGMQALADGGQPGFCPNGPTTCAGAATLGIPGAAGIVSPPGSLGLMGCAILALAGVLLWRRERRRTSFVTSLQATIHDWNLLAHQIRLSHSQAGKSASQPKTKTAA